MTSKYTYRITIRISKAIKDFLERKLKKEREEYPEMGLTESDITREILEEKRAKEEGKWDLSK